jgi:hypothetical protein
MAALLDRRLDVSAQLFQPAIFMSNIAPLRSLLLESEAPQFSFPYLIILCCLLPFLCAFCFLRFLAAAGSQNLSPDAEPALRRGALPLQLAGLCGGVVCARVQRARVSA